jgi:hypothetical protein
MNYEKKVRLGFLLGNRNRIDIKIINCRLIDSVIYVTDDYRFFTRKQKVDKHTMIECKPTLNIHRVMQALNENNDTSFTSIDNNFMHGEVKLSVGPKVMDFKDNVKEPTHKTKINFKAMAQYVETVDDLGATVETTTYISTESSFNIDDKGFTMMIIYCGTNFSPIIKVFNSNFTNKLTSNNIFDKILEYDKTDEDCFYTSYYEPSTVSTNRVYTTSETYTKDNVISLSPQDTSKRDLSHRLENYEFVLLDSNDNMDLQYFRNDISNIEYMKRPYEYIGPKVKGMDSEAKGIERIYSIFGIPFFVILDYSNYKESSKAIFTTKYIYFTDPSDASRLDYIKSSIVEYCLNNIVEITSEDDKNKVYEIVKNNTPDEFDIAFVRAIYKYKDSPYEQDVYILDGGITTYICNCFDEKNISLAIIENFKDISIYNRFEEYTSIIKSDLTKNVVYDHYIYQNHLNNDKFSTAFTTVLSGSNPVEFNDLTTRVKLNEDDLTIKETGSFLFIEDDSYVRGPLGIPYYISNFKTKEDDSTN